MAVQEACSVNEAPSYDLLNYKSPYKQQQNSLAGVLLPVMSFGMHMFWGIYVLFLPNRWIHSVDITKGHYVHAVLAVYLGNIIGGILAFISIRRFHTTWICYISGVFSIISGILYIPYWYSILPIALGRYFGGVGQGMAFVTAIIYGPEISIKYFRGSIMSTIHFAITGSLVTASIVIAIIYDQNIFNDGTLDMIFGSIIILFGILGIIMTPFFVYESPVFFIENHQDYDAIKVMTKLRGADIETEQTRIDFLELKELYDRERGQNLYTFKGLITKPFLKIMGLRLLNTFSFSLLITWIFFGLALEVSVQFGIVVVLTARFLVELVSLFLVDLVGRRKLIRLSAILCGVFLILIAILLWVNIQGVFSGVPEAIFCFLYGISYGLGMGNVSLTYLGEAFSLRKKPFLVLCSVILDNILEIILIVIASSIVINTPVFLIIVAALQIVGGLYFYYNLPETKYLTLTDCLEKMK